MIPHDINVTRAVIRDNRQRGTYVPTAEAQALIELGGWTLLDDCPVGLGLRPGRDVPDECLLLPPDVSSEAVA
jgi:hypothetical protein